jgi:hypothetical protein
VLRNIDNYFLKKEEPAGTCLQSLRIFILSRDEHITEGWSYSMPFYYYKGKRCCYLWVHKKLKQPYIGIVDGKHIDHPDLLHEKRARMKIFLIDPQKDIPVRKLNQIFKKMLLLYKD